MGDDAETSLATIAADSFAALVGETLRLVDGRGNALPVTLADVHENARAHKPGSPRTPFQLTLYGPSAPVADQGVFYLRHPSLPDLPPVFVAPVVDPEAPRDATGRPCRAYQITFG